MGKIVGIILILVGIADFALSYMGINLTPFLPAALSKFSPMILGGLGLLILNSQSSDSYDDEDTSDISKNDK
jgi:hypothetical protein